MQSYLNNLDTADYQSMDEYSQGYVDAIDHLNVKQLVNNMVLFYRSHYH